LLFGQEQHGDAALHLQLQPHHCILLILLHAPPILQLFGKNEFGTLSHSWFVPSASGCCFLVVPAPFSSNIPSSENGMPITHLRDPTLRADAAAHLLCVKDDAAALFGAKADAGRMRQLVQQCTLINGDWVRVLMSHVLAVAVAAQLNRPQVDICFRLRVDDHDPYNETFGAGPTGFWQAVAEHLGGVCLVLR